jgi:murein DD-endopeptidase MepM/ murein hydrolase activator NlpD
MKNYLKISLPAVLLVLLTGFFLTQSGSTPAQANTDINLPAPLLAQVADSLRTVSVELDATILRLVDESNSVVEAIQVPVTSPALQQLSDSLAAFSLPTLPPLSSRIDAFELHRRIGTQQEIAVQLRARTEEYRTLMTALPTLIPCDGEETSGFGGRIHPIHGVHKMHTGIDIAAPTGTPIYAAGGGVVTFSGRKGGYGNVVEIDHGYGYRTLYAHASKLLVQVGDTISRGDHIALVGSTGSSTGAHLHYETIVNEQKVDPSSFMLSPRVATVTPTPIIASR